MTSVRTTSVVYAQIERCPTTGLEGRKEVAPSVRASGLVVIYKFDKWPRPEGAKTYQPRARSRELRERAAALGRLDQDPLALKGRNNNRRATVVRL